MGPSTDAKDRGIWAEELYGDKEFYDDVAGNGFKHAFIVKARELEMKFFRDWGVFAKVPRSEAAANGCKVISTK